MVSRSWDLDFSDLDCSRTLGDKGGQKRERVLGALRVDEPPDRVAAEEARRYRRLVTQRARVSLEASKRDAALARMMLVEKEILGHAFHGGGLRAVRHQGSTRS